MQTQIQSFCTAVGAPFQYVSHILHINLYMVLHGPHGPMSQSMQADYA